MHDGPPAALPYLRRSTHEVQRTCVWHTLREIDPCAHAERGLCGTVGGRSSASAPLRELRVQGKTKRCSPAFKARLKCPFGAILIGKRFSCSIHAPMPEFRSLVSHEAGSSNPRGVFWPSLGSRLGPLTGNIR